MWEDPHSLKRMWVTCVHNKSMRRRRSIQHVESCLVLSLWAGEDVGEMLILMSFVHHHQRSRIPLNKPTMSGSVCHMSFTATQDPYDPARGKTTVPRTPCVATQERIVHNCTYPLDDPHQVTVRRPNCTHSSLATLLE